MAAFREFIAVSRFCTCPAGVGLLPRRRKIFRELSFRENRLKLREN